MKNLLLLFLLLLILGFNLKAQPPAPSSYSYTTSGPRSVSQINASVIGVQGNQNYTYFVIATYPIGTSGVFTSASVNKANSTLSGSNFNRVTWGLIPGATSYVVLRTTTQNFPASGTCTSCLIASADTDGLVDDVSNTTLGNYTLSVAPGATAIEVLDNLNGAVARLDTSAGQNTDKRTLDPVGVDDTVARVTKPIKTVMILPSTCADYSIVWLIGATAGSNLNLCISNVWYAVSGTAASGGLRYCTQVFSATPTFDFTSCEVIAMAVTATITAVDATGATVLHTGFGQIIYIMTGGGFAVSGFSGTMTGMCTPTAVNNVTTIQSFNYNGTALVGSGCTDSTGVSKFSSVAAPTGVAGLGQVWFDSGLNRMAMNNNAGSTDAIVGRASTDTFTNKTFNTAGTGNSFSINGNAITGVSGTGNTVCLTTGSSCGGGATLTTSAWIPYAGLSTSSVVTENTPNQVFMYELPPFPASMTFATASMFASVSAGNATMGIYDAAATTVLAQGSTVSLTGSNQFHTYTLAYTFLPNTKYFLAITANNATFVMFGSPGGYWGDLSNQGESAGNYHFATCSNPSTGTTTMLLPATCGTRTSTTSFTTPAISFHQ